MRGASVDNLADRMVVCSECGTSFVWTAAQQRQAPGGEAPQRCPVCERLQARLSAPAATVPSGRTEVNGNISLREQGRATPELAPSAHNQTETTSSDYISGTGHPLYGHGGEQHSGTVKWFNDRKGFGFITLDNGIEIFVHYSGIEGDGYKTLKQGQRVQIQVEDTEKGPQASSVKAVEGMEADDTTPMASSA
jgi:CspA family cold shock protein